ncbi:unnamed protein product [marine sediment metagenome]|uniref:Uncharacterized protein n=1 Tax=marine sediment metagenome TaxID=412755 RepID=X0T8Q3_9ZZZZ
MAIRDTQVVVETLLTNDDPNVRNTQVVIEALMTDADPNTRNTQVVVELLVAAYGYASIHQVAVEILSQEPQGNPPQSMIIT